MRMVVISAHAADFVWRCGGTMAAYASAGWDVHVVCVSAGVRGESESLWTAGGPSAEEIEKIRIGESIAAGRELGATVEHLGLGDHPLAFTADTIVRLAQILKLRRPEIVLTHFRSDMFSPDHPEAYRLTEAAVRLANVKGVAPDIAPAPLPQMYCFEPDQCSIEMFNPNIYIDITPSMAAKRAAMETVRSQAAVMLQRYVDRAKFRASLARTFGFGAMKQAEAFAQCFPWHGTHFPASMGR